MLQQILDEFENWGKRNVHLSLPGREIEAFQSMKDFISQTYATARKEALEEVLGILIGEKEVYKFNTRLDPKHQRGMEKPEIESERNKILNELIKQIKNLNF